MHLVDLFNRREKGHLEGEVFDMLLTFTDFMAFKDVFLDYKAVSRVDKLISHFVLKLSI